MIEVREIGKSFGNIKAIDHVTTTIQDGQIFGLVGSNGAGKSTFLRMISGVIKADEGEILVDGKPVFECTETKEEICMLADTAYFLPNTNGKMMRDYYALVYPKFNKEQFDSLAEKFRIDLDRKVNTFSKGMKKQLSMMLGVCANTKYLLCDETFDGLDPVMRQAVKSLFAGEVINREFTPVIASHNLRELEDICDSIGLLHKGGILFTKDLEDMKFHIHKVQCVIQNPLEEERLLENMDVLQHEKRGSLLTFIARGTREKIVEQVEQAQPVFVETVPLSLEEIFISEMEVEGYDIKSSFVKLLREDLKKRMWLTALSAVIFIIVIPLINLLQAQSLYNGAGGIGDAAQTNWEQLCEWFAAEAGFSGGALRMSALIFGAVACGISSFSYLHSKSQVDFYHSLPVRRETWFAVTCTGSIVQIVIPYLVSYALLLVTGCAKGLMQADILRRCPLVVGMNLLYFLMLYSITVFAMMVTGKILMALFVLLLLSFGGSYIVSMKDYIMVQCYETYLSDSLSYGLVGNVLFGDAGWYSPVMLGSGMKYLYGTGQLWKGAAVMAAVTILSIAAALLLYRRRASESAGNALAFPKLMPAVKILTAVMTAVMFGAIAGSQNRQNGMNAGWLFGVGILTAVLTCAVMEFIYHTDIRLVFQKKCSLAVSVSAVVLILAAAEYDWFGYDTYLPERDEIKAMAFVSNVEKYRWAGANDTYFWDKMLEGGMNNLKVEQFDTIYDAAANGVANVGTDEALDSAVVAYYLKNGRTVYRQYRIEDDMLSRCMEELLDREGYRRKVFKMDILDGEKSDFQFLNFRQESVYVEVSKEEERKLLDTYRRELEEKPVSSFCQEEMVGEFSIVIESGVEGRQFYYTGRIYRSFTETLALLEQYGYNAATKIEPEEVKSMTHYKENEETAAVTEQNGERSGADGRPVTDREEMQRILERVMWNSYDWEKGYETVADYYYGPEWVEIEFEDGHIAQYPLREEV